MLNLRKIVIDPFCFRQFDSSLNDCGMIQETREEFESKINLIYNQSLLVDGYAPFCKHLFVENWTNTPNIIVQITQENQNLLKTEYEARTEKELPVLVRYFLASTLPKPEVARYLDIILYSKEQIQLENHAMGNVDPNKDCPYEYGIVSVKPQPVCYINYDIYHEQIDHEIQMNPSTMLRNALGKAEGGSGVPLNREKYMQSVEFWSKNALVR